MKRNTRGDEKMEIKANGQLSDRLRRPIERPGPGGHEHPPPNSNVDLNLK